MKTTKSTGKPAIIAATAMVFALSMVAANVTAAKAADMEKCYGIAKAGKNDCKTATGSCAGTSKMDRQGSAFIAVPKGTCDKIAGGSLTPKS